MMLVEIIQPNYYRTFHTAIPGKVVNFLPVFEGLDLVGVEVGVAPADVELAAVARNLAEAVRVQYQPDEPGVCLLEPKFWYV